MRPFPVRRRARTCAILVTLPTLGLVAARPAAAQRPDSTAAAADSARRLDAVTVTATVTGRGSTRAASAVDSTVLRAAAPGTSALKAIERLPGVNVQGADGFGMYEWANRITMRGFQTAQIGQTMDGIPLGDMSYGNFNGLGVGRAVDPSNVAATVVTQGTGALATASANNLGGVVQYASAEPGARRQFLLQQMVGEYAARRTTLRWDTGLLSRGTAGGSAYVSYARFDTDKWKSSGRRFSAFPGEQSLLFGQRGFVGRTGEQWQDQVNVKANLFAGRHKLTAFYDYAQRKESDYMDLSLSIFDRTVQAPGFDFGPGFDYLADWTRARQLAELSTGDTYDPLTDAAYYYSAQGARQDHLVYLKGEFALGDRARLEVQPYAHTNRGGGDWHAPSYGAAWSPDPIHFRQTQYRGTRQGALARLTTGFQTGAVEHAFEVGGWLESNESRIRRPRWGLRDYGSGPEVNFDDVIRLDFDRTGDITTTTTYVQNTSRLADGRVAVSYGAKYLRVGADFVSNGNTPTDGVVAPLFADADRPALSAPTDGALLPQVGVIVRPTRTEELFANWAENMNQFPYNPGGGVYNAAASTFDYFRTTAKPERATTIEAGARTRRGPVEAGLTGYVINYRNRLIGIALCPATVTCATGFGNVGSVRSRGAEAVLAATVVGGLRVTSSASYNVSTYEDDYLANQSDATSRVATRGKDVVDAPRWLGSAGVAYDRGRIGAAVSGRYVDRRFFTYTNDLVDVAGGTVRDGGMVPSYVVADLSARYRIGALGGLRTVDAQLNVANLFDRRYVGTVGTNGFTASSDFQTLLTGAPRQLFFTLGTTF